MKGLATKLVKGLGLTTLGVLMAAQANAFPGRLAKIDCSGSNGVQMVGVLGFEGAVLVETKLGIFSKNFTGSLIHAGYNESSEIKLESESGYENYLLRLKDLNPDSTEPQVVKGSLAFLPGSYFPFATVTCSVQLEAR